MHRVITWCVLSRGMSVYRAPLCVCVCVCVNAGIASCTHIEIFKDTLRLEFSHATGEYQKFATLLGSDAEHIIQVRMSVACKCTICVCVCCVNAPYVCVCVCVCVVAMTV
jgi:hypothetical protein